MAAIQNEYHCANCGGPAIKKPLKALRDWKTAEPTEFGNLGTWHCVNRCVKGRVKVKRFKIQFELAKAA